MTELTNITDQELDVFVKTFIEQDITDPEEMISQLTLIDKQLTVMNSKALLTRKSPKLKSQLDALIRCHRTGETALWNNRTKRYSFTKPHTAGDDAGNNK